MMLLAWFLGTFCCGFANPTGAAPPAGAAEPLPLFDIASQPLHNALQAYSKATGRSVLYDAGQVEGLFSPGIRGHMDPDRALDTLLEGTGMRARFAPSGAFVLVPEDADRPASGGGPVLSASQVSFFHGRLQAVVTSILCADAGLSIGQYRLAISTYVDSDGKLEQLRVVAAGHAELEPRIVASLTGKSVGMAPPPEMAQPIALLVTPQHGRLKACAS